MNGRFVTLKPVVIGLLVHSETRYFIVKLFEAVINNSGYIKNVCSCYACMYGVLSSWVGMWKNKEMVLCI